MEKRTSFQTYTLIAVNLASFLPTFMTSAVNIAIPSIGEQFGSGALELGWVMTVFLLGSTVFLVPFGRLADIIGRKKVFISGMVVFILSTAFCAVSKSIGMLIVGRAFHGASSSMVFSTVEAILASVFPPQKRGRMLGLNAAVVYIGFSLGPVLGGILNHWLGWAAIFYLGAVLGAVTIVITLVKLKGEWTKTVYEKYDWIGTILYVSGLVIFMYGISAVASSGIAKYVVMAGVVLVALFVIYSMRVSNPMLNVQLFFKNKAFAFPSLTVFLNYVAIAGLSFFLSVYLQVIRGFESQTAGGILIAQPIMMVILAPVMGRISDRINPRTLASMGMILTALGVGLLSFLGIGTPVWFIMVCLAMLGAGMALFSAPNTNAVLGSVEERHYGIASSVIGTMRMAGQSVSLAIMTLIINMYIGNIEFSLADASRLISGGNAACIVFALFGVAGVVTSFIRGKRGAGSSARPV